MKCRSLSLTDVVTSSICGLVVFSVILTGVLRYRSVARRTSCANNLRRIGLAFHNYHAAYKQLPMGCGGTSAGSVEQPRLGNANRLSPLVGLLPFAEQQSLWEAISNPSRRDGEQFFAMGPVPWFDPQSYKPWGMRPDIYVCPADREDAKSFSTATSYAINYGDGIREVGAALNNGTRELVASRAVHRGTFQAEKALKFRDILDGLKHTILISERRIGGPQVAKNVDRNLTLNPALCITARQQPGAEFWPDGRHACWADGSLLSMGLQTVLPPNSPSATTRQGELEGVMSASSNHGDGVHVMFADGLIRFATNSIDAGDSSSPSVAFPQDGAEGFATPGSASPYGLWGALGTRASKETIKGSDETLIPPPLELSAEELAEIESKPLLRWTESDGSTVLNARFLGIQSGTKVVLLTDQDRQKFIPLSALQSQDAYRAVELFVEQEEEKRRSLVAQLEAGVKLLNQGKMDEFISTFVDGELSEQEKEQLSRQRDLLIMQMEAEIRGPRNLSPATRQKALELFKAFRSRGYLNLRPRQIGNRWKLVK